MSEDQVNYQSFSKAAHRLLKFHMKLEGLKGQNLTDPNVLKNFSFWRKSLKILGFFWLSLKISSIDVLFLPYKWCTTIFFVILQKPRVCENSGSSAMA